MKAKGKKKEVPFKLEYLRQISKNLMLHATQPHEKEFGMFDAPSIVLRRVIHILESLTKSYKRAFEITKSSESAAKKAGKPGSLEHEVRRLTDVMKSFSKRHMR